MSEGGLYRSFSFLTPWCTRLLHFTYLLTLLACVLLAVRPSLCGGRAGAEEGGHDLSASTPASTAIGLRKHRIPSDLRS
jgi:hypothetical protein